MSSEKKKQKRKKVSLILTNVFERIGNLKIAETR
jgi:hypothetical protein